MWAKNFEFWNLHYVSNWCSFGSKQMGLCEQRIFKIQTCLRYQSDVVLGENRWDFVTKLLRVANSIRNQTDVVLGANRWDYVSKEFWILELALGIKLMYIVLRVNMGLCEQRIFKFQTCIGYQSDVVFGTNRWDFVSKGFWILKLALINKLM